MIDNTMHARVDLLTGGNQEMPKRASDNKEPQKKNQTTIQMNVSVPLDVYKRVCAECASLGISRSAYVTMTLNQKWQQEEFTRNLPDVLKTFTRMLDKIDDKDIKGI